MIAPKGRLLNRRPGRMPSRDTEGGRSLPKVTLAILKTLKYSDHFGFPLTPEEIHLRFVGESPCARPLIVRTIRQMIQDKLVQQTRDYYHLAGHQSLVARRLAHQKSSAPQLTRAKALAVKLGRVPGVLAIYLTGSLAMSNSDKNADIDFMVITQNSRLWTTRFLLTLYTEFLGLRRRPRDPHTAGKACLNLYLSPHSYLLPPNRRSLYTAYELIQAVPLYDPSDTHSRLLASNPWIHDFLPNVPIPRTVPKRNSWLQAKKGSPAGEGTVLNGILNLIEFLVYRLQLAYMRPRLTREYISPDSAFFHPRNPAPKI